jgi:formylglycine-generating enzyme required for sulfatase activity
MLKADTLLQDRYRIISLINQGNMGAVYLAEDQRLGNEVALKETFAAGGDAMLRDQFHREARLLSRLRHPGLPRVIDHFIEGNDQFLVMDYIVGKDLKESLEEQGGPFPVNKVLAWADQLLEVLAYLHAHADPVIHRDIKPANIKLTPLDKVILLDFGLAKGSSSSLLMSLHAVTMAYAPIEQIMGLGTDGRSDLYALGVTLYHLLTNALPPMALQRQGALANGMPDPLQPANELNPQVPQRVADVLMQAMSQNCDQRPASAAVMRRMLCDAASNEQPTIIAPVAPVVPEIAATIPIASEPRKDNDSPTITMPPPVVDHLSTLEARAHGIATRTEKENHQPERVPSPPLARVTQPSLLPQIVQKMDRISWMWLGIVALLIATTGVFFVILNRKPIATSDTSGATAQPEGIDATAAGPRKSYVYFYTVTLNAKGEIIDRRDGEVPSYVEIINGVELEMVEIPGGTFQMGSPANETSRSSEEGPQHQVTVSPFYIGKYEVTQAQWRAVASLPKVSIDLQPNPSVFKGDNLPVERVSWEDAAEFCARLSKAVEKPYRLPTEAEWEYACRAKTKMPFAFGETITPEQVNYNGNYPYANAPKGNYRKQTTPVGSLGAANGFGLFDMHGNVWEWCNDWYSGKYDSQGPSADPTGSSSGSVRVTRGGGCDSIALKARSAFRSRATPSFRSLNLGFRLVRTSR